MGRANARAPRPGYLARLLAPRTAQARGERWPAPLWTLFAPIAGHEPVLDGLRGVSSVAVLVFHCIVWLAASFPEVTAELPQGFVAFWWTTWFGVDTFFVLSGFLIGRILMRRLAQGALGFRAFYARRSFRIFPVYYLVLAASVYDFSRIDAWRVLYRGASHTEIVDGAWANFLYVSNYVFGMGLPNALSWGWSLCVEEHFYLLLPAVLALLWKLLRPHLRLLVLVALVALPTWFRWLEYQQFPDRAVFLWVHPMSHTHADGLALGLVIAYTHVFHRDATQRFFRRLGNFTWILGVLCIAATMRFGGLRTPGYFPVVWQYLVVALGAALLLVNGLYLSNPVSRFLDHKAWIPLARVSYCTYLIQMFVIMWTLGFWPRGPFGSTPLALASFAGFSVFVALASFVAAGAIFLLLERPMMDVGALVAARVMPRPRPADDAAKHR